MSLVPSPYTLRVRSLVSGAPDEFGNATTTWAEHDWHVRGIAPGGMVEPGQANRDLSMVSWTVYADVADSVPNAQAEVEIPSEPGKWYRVNGEPAPWNLGPWANPAAGVVVELARADG